MIVGHLLPGKRSLSSSCDSESKVWGGCNKRTKTDKKNDYNKLFQHSYRAIPSLMLLHLGRLDFAMLLVRLDDFLHQWLAGHVGS